jgi:dipeptidyl aminopeptidase/acylaminoacyl peptidase
VRVLAFMVAALGLVTSSSGGSTQSVCPHSAALGTVSFPRGGHEHAVSLATCADRVVGRSSPAAGQPLLSPDGQLAATVRAGGAGGSAKQTIWITDLRTHARRAVFSETEYYKQTGPGDTPGPIILLRFSNDDRWIFFTIDPGGSGSIAADGLVLRVVSTTGGPVHKLGVALQYPDYLAWCGGRLVYVAGRDRVAIHAKRLLVAAPPNWRPAPLWDDPDLSFATPSCRPGGKSVAVLSQRSSMNAYFFATRWQLWNVGLDGTRLKLDAPPPGWADESPRWSRDGRSLLFVRERKGYGRLMLLRDGRLFGPIAKLGFGLGYYGYHDWQLTWSAGA